MGELRVVITRTADAAGELIKELTSGFADSGFSLAIFCAPVRVAAFEVSCLESYAVKILQDGGYDWLTFTSANGVRGFEQLAGSLGVSARVLVGEAHIACVGKATAKALNKLDISPDFIPEIQDAVHMVADWPEARGRQVASEATPASRKVLCIQGANARPTLVEGLNQLGYQADTLTVYRMDMFPAPETLASPAPNQPKVPELATDDVLPYLHQTHILIATAPSLLQELFTEFITQGGEKTDFPRIVAFGATTGEQAQKLGLKYTVAEHPQAVFLTKATKSLADLHFQCAKQPTHTE